MNEKWEWVTLDKLGKLSSGKSLSQKSGYAFSLFFNGDIPLVDGNAISSNRLYIAKCKRYFNIRGTNQNKLFFPETVCFVRCGEIGNSSILKINSCLTESVYSINYFEKISDPKFIKYCFDFSKIKRELLSFSVTTTRQILSFSKLSLVKFPKPPLEVQQKIGEILSKYDLILDNHEKQIELLKKLKISLFKEWFIKLRFPNYENYTIRGGLPEGWTRVKVGEISKIFKGSKPASHANLLGGGGQYPFFTSSFKTKKSYTFSYDLFALLVSEGGSTFHAKIYKGKFETSNHTYVIDLENKENIYLVLEFLNNIYLPKLNWLTYATTFLKNLPPKKLKEIEILIPDQKILEKFNNFWKNIHSKIEKLEQKIEKYEKIKKNLLNSLFSQKINVY